MIKCGKFYLFVTNVSFQRCGHCGFVAGFVFVFFSTFSVKFLKKPGEGGDLIKFFFDLCESWAAVNSLSLSFQPVRRWIFSICTGLICCPDAKGSVGQLLTEAILWEPHLLFIGCSSILYYENTWFVDMVIFAF